MRVLGLPLSVAVGLTNTALIIAHTGDAVFGIVSTVATLALLLPFTDLGIGAVVTTSVARARLSPMERDAAIATMRTAWFTLWGVTLLGIVLVTLATVLHWWTVLFAYAFDDVQNLVVGTSVAVFFASVPFSLGVRVLIGLDLNHVATILSMLTGVFTLATTAALTWIDTESMWFVLSGFMGTLVSGVVCSTIAARALRKREMWPFGTRARIAGRDAAPTRRARVKLLSGSGWMLIVMMGLPAGLQTGRIIISHTQGDVELSEFALAAQLYVMAWGIMVTAGNALWSMFARQRDDPQQSYAAWKKMVLLFGALATTGGLLLTLVGPPLANFVSGGQIAISTAQMAAFSVLIFVQSLHLPGGVLLTTPVELRWQAMCTTAMATISLAVGIALAPQIGGVGVTIGAIVGVFIAQFLPDLFMVRKFLYRRPEAANAN